MEKGSILRVLKQCFVRVVPYEDKRVGLPHLEFIVGLSFCFMGDAKRFGLETIRRFMISTFKVRISKGAFWERLSRNRLKNLLYGLVFELMNRLRATVMVGEEILSKLGVSSIELMDSSSITLWDGASESYPGTRTNAGIKWHACFDLLAGKMSWFTTTATKVNDRKCFPNIASLVGKLIIFDLGYWDYGLLMAIDATKGFFLSRVKTNAAILIKKVTKGMSPHHVGKKLSTLKFKRKRGKVIEFSGEITHKGESAMFRVIGCWNPNEKQYHWYITNLSVLATIIYSLYRVRWQLELIFKGCKQSFNLDQKPASNNNNIIESLVICSIIASFASQVVLSMGASTFTKAQKRSISFQRIAHLVVLLAIHFINYLTKRSIKYGRILIEQLTLLAPEMIEKNYQHRPTTLGRLSKQLGIQ
jgi:hypothetical protein